MGISLAPQQIASLLTERSSTVDRLVASVDEALELSLFDLADDTVIDVVDRMHAEQ